jgi:hypothetical protein
MVEKVALIFIIAVTDGAASSHGEPEPFENIYRFRRFLIIVIKIMKY